MYLFLLSIYTVLGIITPSLGILPEELQPPQSHLLSSQLLLPSFRVESTLTWPFSAMLGDQMKLGTHRLSTLLNLFIPSIVFGSEITPGHLWWSIWAIGD